MSGRELAFDRSVTRGHRRAVPIAAPRDCLVGSLPKRGGRPDASFLVEAISSAAASISAKDERIRQLEQHHDEVQDLVDQMKSKLDELVRLQRTTDARANAEAERADRAEAKATRLEVRVHDLERDLDAAVTDLHRIADVITGSLVKADRA